MIVPIALIVAVGENGVIGSENAIPWRLPSDFAHFKRSTLGKPLIMGRKTFESIGKPLPGRTNLIVTRQADYQPDGVLVFPSLSKALERAQLIAEADGASEVMVGGGGEIYRAAMRLAERLYVTHVATSPDGDTHFPTVDPKHWEVDRVLDIQKTERDSASFAVKVYRRRDASVR